MAYPCELVEQRARPTQVVRTRSAVERLPQVLGPAWGAAMLPLSLAYLLVGRLALAKVLFADERCTSCGACAAGCPQGAIRMVGPARRPYWTFRCENCMRCMSRCPEDAIQGAQAWLLFYVWAAGLPVAKSEGTQVILHEIEPGVWGKGGEPFSKRMKRDGIEMPPT